MPLVCPICAQQSLEIQAAIALPPDAYSDNISLQLVACAKCLFRALAVYDESGRGAHEHCQHMFYRLPEASLSAIAERIAACPDPRRRSCACAAHRLLGAQFSSGEWMQLANLGIALARTEAIAHAGA